MNNMRKAEGEIDLTDEQHITDVWGNKGETVDVKDDEENGEETNTFWPDEITDPKEDMTRKQRHVITAAVMNPSLDTEGIAEKTKEKGGYVRATLRRCVPEWYENVFKPSTTESNCTPSDVFNNIARDCPECGIQVILHEKMNGMTVLRCNCGEFEIEQSLPDRWLRYK